MGVSPRFSGPEKRKMEKLLEEGNDNLSEGEFHQKLTDEFNRSRAKNKAIKVEQVGKWFSNRKSDNVGEGDSTPNDSKELDNVPDSSPAGSKELGAVPDASLSNNAPESSSDMPKDIGKVAEDWVFEAKSLRDGAWYDVATFLSYKFLNTGELEVRVRYEGFGPEEDEWVNVRKGVRERSKPLESTDCRTVAIGDLVLCFRETKDGACHFDAHVTEIQRKLHDIRGCRCLFLIRYDHDGTEERVHLRKMCSRPVLKPAKGCPNVKCPTSPA